MRKNYILFLFSYLYSFRSILSTLRLEFFRLRDFLTAQDPFGAHIFTIAGAAGFLSENFMYQSAGTTR